MKNLIFFDGICLLCNGFVDLLIRLDKHKKLNYAPLQGSTAKSLLNKNYRQLDMVVFKDSRGALFTKSTAVIEIAIHLGGIWKIFIVFKIIPLFMRDWIYDRIATNRYKIFGTRKSCRLPSPNSKDQILP